MSVPADPHGTPLPERARWSSAGLSALLSMLAIVIGLVGTLLALWPLWGIPTLLSAFVVVVVGWRTGQRARREARLRGEHPWRAVLALVVSALSILLVCTFTLAGGAVSALVAWGPHARSFPGSLSSSDEETSWLDRSDSSGTITGRTMVAMGIGFAVIVALGAADQAGLIELSNDSAPPSRCASNDDCDAPSHARCDLERGECVACHTDADCTHQGRARCVDETCRE